MSNLNVTIDELRRDIEADEQSLATKKEGLRLLEKAHETLRGRPMELLEVIRIAVVEPAQDPETPVEAAEAEPATPVSETPVMKNRPRATWTTERRAKTIASMEKLRAAKKRAAKKKKSAK
jgi:hypothetical protein